MIKKIIKKVLLLGACLSSLSPFAVSAAPLSSRSLTLGSSDPSAVTTYIFNFKPGVTGNIGAIKFEICDSPLQAVACVNSGVSSGVSFTSNSASILSQSGISGFTAGTGSPPAPNINTFWITNGTPQNIPTTTMISVTFQNVRNPAAPNKQYYGRMTTYSNSAGTTEVDFGAVAVDIASPIIVSGTMPESLVFCVGTSGTDCTNITGSAVSLGVFSPVVTNTGTSVMSASTNAGFGYVITISGTTLTSGANTITAMGTQAPNSGACTPSCTLATGTSQFGSNVVANTGVGANVSGAGSATGFGGYNTSNAYRYFSGDKVASAGGPTNSNLFTNSYVVNVGGNQAAGVYTATMTYICTSTF